jgi:outer membrane lipoprotein LolB
MWRTGSFWSWGLAVVTAALLAGCAAPLRLAEPPVSPAARRAAIEAVLNWEARGRLALKTQTDSGHATSGQGSFVWTQAGDRTVLRVAGPFGAGAYEIHWEPSGLRVLSGRGEVAAEYTGPGAAERFLNEQLGWSLPVENARHWLLGLAGPQFEAVETLDGDGLLIALEQDGWRVHYDEYRTQGTTALPRKLVLASDSGRIRLVVDQWQFGSAP